MLLKKVALMAAIFSCTAVQANTAPSYHYIQASAERISQSGEDSFSSNGLGLNAAWQLNSNWFLAAEWQRFTDSEKYSESIFDQRFEEALNLSLNRYYLGAGYILPISDTTNISFAGYFGSYRYAASYTFSAFRNDQFFTDKGSYNTTDNSIKTQVMLRSNLNSQLELSGRVYYEYLNDSDLDNKSQYGVGVGALYQLSPRFALSADLSAGKLLDESSKQISVGARYQF